MEELLAIKDRAWEHLCTFPGVHAVGIGKKVTRGIRTDTIAIVVFVERKKPLSALDTGALVPSTFEGVPTDVIDRVVGEATLGLLVRTSVRI